MRSILTAVPWAALGLFLAASAGAQLPPGRILTGWGGGKAADVVPQAAAVGFAELVLHHENTANFATAIELGTPHGIGIYGWMYLGDLPAWKKAFPETEPPLQVMSPAEQETLKRLAADQTPGKSGYQFGGEPANGADVLETPLLCFHDPRVLEALKQQVAEILSVPGVRGVAFDYFGYQNYRCCLCPESQRQLAAYQAQHPELAPEPALERFSLDTLVEFNNRLAAYAYSVRPEAKVITHIYPVYLPQPLYGNRLDLDACGQTAAWFFEPFWSLEKIKSYARVIAVEANRYHPRPRGAALIGYYNAPGVFPVKAPARLEAEIQAILDGGCTRVQVCSFNDVLKTPEAAAVFRRFFGQPPP
jgi:hypothetical protein